MTNSKTNHIKCNHFVLTNKRTDKFTEKSQIKVNHGHLYNNLQPLKSELGNVQRLYTMLSPHGAYFHFTCNLFYFYSILLRGGVNK